MTCRQKINRALLLPRRRNKITPINTRDLLVSEGGVELDRKQTWVDWFKKIFMG